MRTSRWAWLAASWLVSTSAWAYGPNICDFDGDGKSDYVVVRNVGGQAHWWVWRTGGAGTLTFQWGLGTDNLACGDFNGDGKDDATVWRSGAPGAFWVLLTNGGVVYAPFGLTGDNPTVIGDYDGDLKDDMAVFRPGASAGAQSTWWYKRSSDSALIPVAWGANPDFPIPGDFDGDLKADFTIQRNVGGAGYFWRRGSLAGGVSVYPWGLASDFVDPLDFSGDGRVDTMVNRSSGGVVNWYGLNGATGTPLAGLVWRRWGVSGDSRVPGDYDGDGKADIAIWRSGRFWVLNSATSSVGVFNWGVSGDVPVASFNNH